MAQETSKLELVFQVGSEKEKHTSWPDLGN